MNLEEIWVRGFVTTYGRASLPAKPEFPISVRNRNFLNRNRNFWFGRKRCSTIFSNKVPHPNFLQIHHWKYADSGPWQDADRFSVRKHSEVKIRFVSVTFFSEHNLENSTSTVLKT